MPDPYKIVHLVNGPWYGPVENAFSTLRKDMGDFAHVFVDVTPMAGDFHPSESWVKATEDIQQRCDQHIVPGSEETLNTLLLSPDVLKTIVYDSDSLLGPFPTDEVHRALSDVRFVDWTFHGGQAWLSATPWLSPRSDERTVPPLLDYPRLIGLAGKVSRTTVGVFWDPGSEDGLESVVSGVASRIRDLGPARVVTVDSDSSAGPETSPDVEICRRRWEIGFDWMYCSLCDAAVCPAGNRSYPYLLACSMAMGKPCVAVGSPDRVPDFVRHAVTCLVAQTPDEACDMAAWLLRNRDKARRLAAAGQYVVATQDKEAGLVRMRKLIFDQ